MKNSLPTYILYIFGGRKGKEKKKKVFLSQRTTNVDVANLCVSLTTMKQKKKVKHAPFLNQRICHDVVQAVIESRVAQPSYTCPPSFASTCCMSSLALSVSKHSKSKNINYSQFLFLLCCCCCCYCVLLWIKSQMAWTPLRTKSFVVKDGESIDNGGGVGLLFNCWDEIEESEQWQRGIYYALCASYALVSFIALVCTFYFWELNIISWSLFLFFFLFSFF